MGIALPQFLLNIDGTSGGILLLGIVGVCIIFPLTIAVIYLSRSSKYTGNYVMHHTMYAYYHFMKPSLAPRYRTICLIQYIFTCNCIMSWNNDLVLSGICINSKAVPFCGVIRNVVDFCYYAIDVLHII